MSRQPNILFIMCDDHAANAISAYGSCINSTPNIDRIANEGMRFNHCYVTNSICTPSRATVLTGTHSHVNGVTTLDTHLDNRLPNVAKHLQTGGYQTAIVGKWHLGEGKAHCPTGFDYWSVLPDQGEYYQPEFIEMGETRREQGYVSDITTDKCLDWLKQRDHDKPFFLMCHHKSPHRPFTPKDEHRSLYLDDFPQPQTFDDDYANRAKAALEAKMRISEDMTYNDIDLVEPANMPADIPGHERKVPWPDSLDNFSLTCALSGETFTFDSHDQLKDFKYQRYIRKYVQCVHSIDENVGRLLDHLDNEGLSDDTLVVYTSDQGFYLGEHGWFDKRFIYEESFQMPLLMKYPRSIAPASVDDNIVSNLDFAQTFLDAANLTQPNYMQGRSLKPLMQGQCPESWSQVAYHRYWMNQDEVHNACAHYGIRTQQYKLIYWYNEDLGQIGAHPGTIGKEWELFDLEADPLELFNVYQQPEYAAVTEQMTQLLNREMDRIGDTPLHR